MRIKITTIAAVCAALLMSSCGKKLDQFSAYYFYTNPNPLEVVGEKVPAMVTANIPPKFFLKNAKVTITPYLDFGNKESVASQAFTFQGEKVRGNDPVISYENGGNFTIPVSFNYNPKMAKSVLELNFVVDQNGKVYTLPRVQVATGCIATAALADVASVTPAVSPDKFQRIINEKYAADIMFLINRANIRADQLKTDAMQELWKEVAATKGNDSRVLREINIESYASPDGSYDFNYKLAEEREATTDEYVRKQIQQDKITEFGDLTSQFTAEDWEGFKKLVSQSNIQDKELILSVLTMYKDPEERETQLRYLASVFESLADQILPQLRYSRITASVDVIGLSDEELIEKAKNSPSELDADEILYAATLIDNLNVRKQVLESACSLFKNDYRAFNNLGAAQYQLGDYNAASKSFEKALALTPNPESNMNLALIDMITGKYDDALQLLGTAAGVKELDDALGTYYLKMGDNTAAAHAFGDVKSNNAALAQILTKDYTKAASTLQAINSPDATTFYLKAILGARTNNTDLIASNLVRAVQMDPAFADYAAKDNEFSRYDIRPLLKK